MRQKINDDCDKMSGGGGGFPIQGGGGGELGGGVAIARH